MAEGFARALGGDGVEVKSAGTSAMGIVNRETIKVMSECGIDISTQTSDYFRDDMVVWADYVITLGCCSAKELCPVTFKGAMEDWPIEDPLGCPWEDFIRIRDDIGARVKDLLERIT